MRVTPENIEDLGRDEIFVFGSNEAGIHGAGAARLAHDRFGARLYQGFGLSGRSFAIPTKDWEIEQLNLYYIAMYIYRFVEAAKRWHTHKFMVTQVGCGLAGYTPEQIAPYFKDCIDMENVYLPQSFIDIILGRKDKEIGDKIHEKYESTE